MRSQQQVAFKKIKAFEKDSVEKNAAHTQALRDSTKNIFHMALVALTDYGFYFDMHMIVFCSKEYRIFHGWMQNTIKNPKGSAEFYRDMAMGGVKSPLLRAIDTTFQAYGRVDDLARMGFVVEVRGPTMPRSLIPLVASSFSNVKWRSLCGPRCGPSRGASLLVSSSSPRATLGSSQGSRMCSLEGLPPTTR